MLLHYGLIKVLRVKAYTQGTFRLAGVSEHYQAVGLVTGAITPFQDHVIQSLFNLVPVLNWDLPPG